MNRSLPWLLVSLILFSIACSDSTGDKMTPDMTSDAAMDMTISDMGKTDMASDMETDAPTDASMDTGQDMPDMMLDMGPLVCGDECQAPSACVSGACMEPVSDLDAYAAEAKTRPSSYIRSIQFPAAFDPTERCCFDYNGDGRADDGFGVLVGLLGSIPGNPPDPTVAVMTQVRDDVSTYVIDWRQLPTQNGRVQFSIFQGTNDLDANGTPDMAFDNNEACVNGTRCGGSGAYNLWTSSFGTHGALLQFNDANVSDGVVTASGGSGFRLALDLGLFSGGRTVYEFEDVRFRATVTEEANGVHSVDETRVDGDGNSYEVGGAIVGGVLPIAGFLGPLDDNMRACSCAGIDANMPVLEWSTNVESGVYEIACTANIGDATQCTGSGVGDGEICPDVGTVCGFVSIIGSTLDVDTDNDNINDALSVGLRFSLTGASIEGVDPN